jgi:putative hydrolase
VSTSGPFGTDGDDDDRSGDPSSGGPGFGGPGGFGGGGFGGFGGAGFGDMGMFLQDLSRMLSGRPGGSWESAAQLASSIANGGRPEANVDPVDRMAVEQLARVAELQAAEATGDLTDRPVRLEALNRSQWARRFLDDERPLIEGLADSIGAALRAQLGEVERELDDDPDLLGELPGGIPGMPDVPGMSADALIRQVMSMMGPMLLGMMAGSTAGHLAARALGHYELPLPRPEGESLTVVLTNVDAFAQEWSLPQESIRLWVCLSDVVHDRVLRVPHVRARLEELLADYTSSFSDDPASMERRFDELGVTDLLGSGDPDMAALQRLAGDPDLLLGTMQSDHQRDLMPRIETLVATVEGYVDHVLDHIGGRLLQDYDRVTEALRRRRVEFGPEQRFVEHLFGLELSQSTFDRGAGFVDGIVERAGDRALDALWSDPGHLPTPAELDAPGLWLARIGIEIDDAALGELPDDFSVPDYPDLPEGP